MLSCYSANDTSGEMFLQLSNATFAICRVNNHSAALRKLAGPEAAKQAYQAGASEQSVAGGSAPAAQDSSLDAAPGTDAPQQAQVCNAAFLIMCNACSFCNPRGNTDMA